MGSLELDTVVLELEKEDGVADLEKGSAEISNLHHPEILPFCTFDLAASERIHMGSHYLYHFIAHTETLCVLGSYDRVTIGLEGREMIVVKQSGKRTHFEISTEEPSELVGEKRGIEEMFIAIEEHVVPMRLELAEILVLDNMPDDATQFAYMKVRMFWSHCIFLVID